MGLFNVLCLLALISIAFSFSPTSRLNTGRLMVQRQSSLSYRTGDQEMDILINAPDVEYLEYRRAIFNPRNRQQNKAKAMEKEKRKYLEWELFLGRGAMVLFTVMIGHEFLTGENLVHTFFHGP